MKNLDKIIFIVALVACLAGVGVYVGLSSGSQGTGKKSVAKGASIEEWKDDVHEFKLEDWRAPEFDSVTGWNYDLFDSPEIYWLASENRYIAKEIPVRPDLFGVKLISLENPSSRIRISTCSTDFPPKKKEAPAGSKKKSGGYMTVVKFESGDKEQGTVNFSESTDTKLTEKKLEDRRIIVLTPKKPIKINGLNASLVDFAIVKGGDEQGAYYTRYMATIIDNEMNNEKVRIPEEFYRIPERTVAVFVDESSGAQWRVTETIVEGAEAPDIALDFRENSDSPWESKGNKAEFKTESSTYIVKTLDIDNQQATISRQTETKGKQRRIKVRQAVLDVSPN